MRDHARTPVDPAVDIGQLYGAFSTKLQRIVRLAVGDESDAVVEDACQFAWDRLLSCADQVRRETAMAWLCKTAVREALRLRHRQRRCLPFEDAFCGEAEFHATAADPEERALDRERLGLVGRLPERQQQMVWLQAFGLSYAEIANRTGCTTRTVERQLLRAKRTVRAAA